MVLSVDKRRRQCELIKITIIVDCRLPPPSRSRPSESAPKHAGKDSHSYATDLLVQTKIILCLLMSGLDWISNYKLVLWKWERASDILRSRGGKATAVDRWDGAKIKIVSFPRFPHWRIQFAGQTIGQLTGEFVDGQT